MAAVALALWVSATTTAATRMEARVMAAVKAAGATAIGEVGFLLH